MAQLNSDPYDNFIQTRGFLIARNLTRRFPHWGAFSFHRSELPMIAILSFGTVCDSSWNTGRPGDLSKQRISSQIPCSSHRFSHKVPETPTRRRGRVANQ